MVRQRINCNALLFSTADYDFIMQPDISNTTYAGGCLPVVNYDPPPAISSPPALPLKKNSRKKKTGKISVASTETETEVLSQRSANTTDNTDNISKMGSELEEVLKQMDNIK
ncbi:unnamed protein product [Rhizophagus irregularis]|nr:unnamed protein product [Rhizophagus irregularis]CAB5123246.1 unnamed protein product [Rhizophagus irregularis]